MNKQVDRDAVQKWLEREWIITGHEKDEGPLFFLPDHIAGELGLSKWEVKTQLRRLRTIGIVGYKWFEDNMNYCNCINENSNYCTCEYVPFGNGCWRWYFNNWHAIKKYEPAN